MYDRLRENLKEKFEYWKEQIEDNDVIDLSKYDLTRAISDAESFKLYRYIPANYFNIRNIETQKIHLSPNGVMNDVYEGLPSISKDLPYRRIQKLNDLAYMVCMTETKDNMLMWSHYAANHEGFCVEYDLKRLRQQPYNIVEHIFPVVYTSNRQAFRNIDNLIQSHEILKDDIKENAEYDGEEILDNILPLFLTKSNVWQYEKEWRIVYTKNKSTILMMKNYMKEILNFSVYLLYI